MIRLIRLALFVVAILCIAGVACSRGNVPPIGFTTRDSAGVTIAAINGEAWAPDSGWKLGPVDLALGGDTSPGPKLGDVASAALMSDGCVVVTDRGNDAVIVYDPVKRTGRTIATQGHGPGDVSRIDRAWVGVYDSIFTWDHGNHRLQVFAPTGAFVRDVVPSSTGSDVGLYPVGPLPDGTLLGANRTPRWAAAPSHCPN